MSLEEYPEFDEEFDPEELEIVEPEAARHAQNELSFERKKRIEGYFPDKDSTWEAVLDYLIKEEPASMKPYYVPRHYGLGNYEDGEIVYPESTVSGSRATMNYLFDMGVLTDRWPGNTFLCQKDNEPKYIEEDFRKIKGDVRYIRSRARL